MTKTNDNTALIAELTQKIAQLEAKTSHLTPRAIQPSPEEWNATLAAQREARRKETQAVNQAADLQRKRSRFLELTAAVPLLTAELEKLTEELKGDDPQAVVQLTETARNAGLGNVLPKSYIELPRR